jgi:pilus assembly protein Flp/PilA
VVDRNRVMDRIVGRLLDDDRGVTAIEYALVAGLIALVIVVVIGQIGTDISATFSTIATAL